MISSKRVVSLLLCILLVVTLGLTGCQPANTGENTQAATANTKPVETSSGSQAEVETGKGKTLEISWFEGGTGREYIESAIDKYQTMYPDLEIKAEINPKNHEQLRPRFVAGDPPDVFYANSSFLDYFALIADDQLLPLDDILDSPSPDDESVTLREIFIPGMLDRCSTDNAVYALPGFVHYYGLWYDQNTFDRNGWNIPENYAEWVDVSEQIKQSGNMSPFVYQGMYPYYLLRAILFSSACQYGGTEVIKNIDNLVPGAWKDEAILNAARDIKDYCDKYLLNGTLALNHTQAQMELINGSAAMITCGTFLENEMAGNWPDDFDLKYMFPPVNIAGNEEKYIWASSDFRAVPRDAKNPEMGKEFLKIMYSKDMRRVCAETSGSVYPVIGGAEGFEDLLPASVVYANSMLGQDNVSAIFGNYEKWYKTIYKQAQDSLTALISGKYTVEEFAESIEKEAERVRQDDSIIKYNLN